jgi:hypothetical protein
MNRRLTLYVALLWLPAGTMAQTTVDERTESGIASARIAAARKAASVTAQQCLADLSSWRAKDNADDKAKVKEPNFWYEKLSTEELVRRSRESISCSSVLRRTPHREDSPMMTSYGLAFEDELVSRAEAVLVEHNLMHEYMLKSSK